MLFVYLPFTTFLAIFAFYYYSFFWEKPPFRSCRKAGARCEVREARRVKIRIRKKIRFSKHAVTSSFADEKASGSATTASTRPPFAPSNTSPTTAGPATNSFFSICFLKLVCVEGKTMTHFREWENTDLFRSSHTHRAMFKLGAKNLFLLCLLIKKKSAVYSADRCNFSEPETDCSRNGNNLYKS